MRKATNGMLRPRKPFPMASGLRMEGKNMFPEKDCPFIAQYNKEPNTTFCESCTFFARAPKYDQGTKQTNFQKAFICEKDCMIPDVVYQDLEPVMPWE